MDRIELFLYDYIVDDDWSGTSASHVARTLANSPDARVDLHVNSYGGDAHEGLAIYNALRRHRGRVTAHIDNAFSAASVVILGAEERLIGRGGMVMIHTPYSWWLADSYATIDDMKQTAARFEQLAGLYADVYAAHTGLTTEQALAAMEAETWYPAADAVTHGFADRIEGDPVVQAGALWTPDAVASLRQSSAPKFALALQQKGAFVALSMGRSSTQPKSLAMSKPTFMDRVRKALGQAEGTTDDEIAEAVERLASDKEQTPDPDPKPDDTPPVKTDDTPEVTTDKDADLAAENVRLRDRVDALEAEGHEREIKAAVASFKIPAADEVEWKKDFKANASAARRSLARIPDDTVKPDAKVTKGTPGDPVVLTRAEYRDPKTYRAAKAQAKERGVKLTVID